eukprot:2078016-Prymnesium_polylepis.1
MMNARLATQILWHFRVDLDTPGLLYYDSGIDAIYLSSFGYRRHLSGRWPILSPKAVSGHYARPA